MDPVVETIAAVWYPGWAPWVLWIVVVAALVMFLAEWPKRRWFKPAPGEPPTTKLQKAWRSARGETAKIGLLAPLLAGLGIVIGAPAYHEAGLLDSWFLCILLGAGNGVLSAPIYNRAVIPVLALVPKLVGRSKPAPGGGDGGGDGGGAGPLGPPDDVPLD
jgi:hypothetical protein